jgi:hypothetical protein
LNAQSEKALRALTAWVHIEDGKANDKLTFRWTVTGGTIVDGQGTRSIKIKGDAGATTATASLEIEGLECGCQHAASCSLVAD